MDQHIIGLFAYKINLNSWLYYLKRRGHWPSTLYQKEEYVLCVLLPVALPSLLPLYRYACTHAAHTHTHHNKYKLTEMTMNLLCPCQSTSQHEINTQSDYIRRARCNIWTPIRLSDNHSRIIFRIHSFTMLVLYSLQTEGKQILSRNSQRPRLISVWYLFAMRISFQAAESRQAPARLNLPHRNEIRKIIICFCWTLGEGHHI